LDKQLSYLVLALTNSQSTKHYIILRHALNEFFLSPFEMLFRAP
jgi:hypothetical protein